MSATTYTQTRTKKTHTLTIVISQCFFVSFVYVLLCDVLYVLLYVISICMYYFHYVLM